jgi:hypothetical protein
MILINNNYYLIINKFLLDGNFTLQPKYEGRPSITHQETIFNKNNN